MSFLHIAVILSHTECRLFLCFTVADSCAMCTGLSCVPQSTSVDPVGGVPKDCTLFPTSSVHCGVLDTMRRQQRASSFDAGSTSNVHVVYGDVGAWLGSPQQGFCAADTLPLTLFISRLVHLEKQSDSTLKQRKAHNARLTRGASNFYSVPASCPSTAACLSYDQ